MSDYIPIDCNYYDELEALATLRKPAKVYYISEANEIAETSSLIEDFLIKDKVEYMVMKNGIQIRLDTIVEVNGKKRPISGCRI